MGIGRPLDLDRDDPGAEGAGARPAPCLRAGDGCQRRAARRNARRRYAAERATAAARKSPGGIGVVGPAGPGQRAVDSVPALAVHRSWSSVEWPAGTCAPAGRDDRAGQCVGGLALPGRTVGCGGTALRSGAAARRRGVPVQRPGACARAAGRAACADALAWSRAGALAVEFAAGAGAVRAGLVAVPDGGRGTSGLPGGPGDRRAGLHRGRDAALLWRFRRARVGFAAAAAPLLVLRR